MSSKTLCACGCGTEINSWCTYSIGHYPRTATHVALMSEAVGDRSGENNAFYGLHHSEETKVRLSESHLREQLSEETLKKMSQARLGTVASDETRERMSAAKTGERNPFYGRIHSSESLELMSKAQVELRKDLKHMQRLLRRKPMTPAEEELLAIIERHELPLVYNGRAEHLTLRGKVPDFVDLESQHAIEVTRKSNLNSALDKESLYKAEDWKLLILLDDDVFETSEDILVDRLRKFLSG